MPDVPVDRALARRLTAAASAAIHWTQERDRLIADAVEAGASQREVAALVGLTQPGIGKIIKRKRTVVDHTCGDPRCTDPDHLAVRTE